MIRTMSRWLCFGLLILTMSGCGPAPITPVTATPKEPTPAMPGDWPFTDAEEFEVFTLKRIMDGTQPILYVTHDKDGDWQFLDAGDLSEAGAALVSLKSIVKLDPSIKTLADLPLGWAAKRSSVEQPWDRFQP